MEKSTLQQLINQTGEALVQAGASSYYQKVFKTLTRQLLLYSHEQCSCTVKKQATENKR